MLGADWLMDIRARIDFEYKHIISKKSGAKLELVNLPDEVSDICSVFSDASAVEVLLHKFGNVFDEPTKAFVNPVKFWLKEDKVIRVPRRTFAQLK
jgi:hypothetical protein